MNYGERLKTARKHKGWTQLDLEKATGHEVSQGTISKIERGDQKNSAYDILLAVALEIHPKWLYDGDTAFIPEWLNQATKVNESSQTYLSNKFLAKNIAVAIKLLKEMTEFQQDEWLAIGQKFADLNRQFKESYEKEKRECESDGNN